MAPRIFDLGTSLRWVVSFTHRPLYSQGTAHCIHWIGGWVGPRAVVKREIPSPCQHSNPRSSSPLMPPFPPYITMVVS
jgi:hypothetical protein